MLRHDSNISTPGKFYWVREHFLIGTALEGVLVILTIKHGQMDLPSRILELEPTLLQEADLLHQRLEAELRQRQALHRELFSPSHRDRRQTLVHRLRHFRYDERTSLGRRLAELTPSLPNRALLIALTDMHDPSALRALKHTAQRHDTVVLQLRDPAEIHLRGSGFFHAHEAETGHAFVTHGRKVWLDPETVAGELKRGGIDHLVLPIDEPFTHRLRSFFQARNMLGRGAR